MPGMRLALIHERKKLDKPLWWPETFLNLLSSINFSLTARHQQRIERRAGYLSCRSGGLLSERASRDPYRRVNGCVLRPSSPNYSRLIHRGIGRQAYTPVE